jgi:hypothetical protein
VSRGPLTRYATSTKHITGCALAIVGPTLAVAGVLAPPVGLALVPVLYAVGAFAAPARRRVNIIDGLDLHDVQRSLEQLQRRTLARVPDRIALKVTRIATTITETLPRAGALGAGSPGPYVLVACATDYLPTAVQAYLDLPRGYADHHVVADGKTPLDLLAEQLDLLSNEIDDIVENINAADSGRLLAHGRFLAEKFGHGPLDIGDTTC